jgi:type II secretory pathway pseudopilin PulG
MKPSRSPQKCAGLTLLEVLVLLAVVGVLVWMVIPQTSPNLIGGQMTGTLNNARQLQIATQVMALDTKAADGKGLDWTTITVNGKSEPVSLAAYFQALTENNYLSDSDLRKLLRAPGRSPGNGPLTTETIPFRFFVIDGKSPENQPFVVTTNWKDRVLTSEMPYGKKGFVVFGKGGSGGIYRRPEDASSPGIFPTGPKYRYETLR